MSYNARVKATQRRAPGMYGHDRGWTVGSNQGSAIGIPSRLVNKINQRTSTFHMDASGVLRDTKTIVLRQNTLGGIGRYRSQFNVLADGIKYDRYYLDK